MGGKFGKFGLKVLFVSCTFIVRVAKAQAGHESTTENFRGCSRDDKPVFIEEINKQGPSIKNRKISNDFIERS